MAYKVGVIGTGAIGVEHARRINQRIGGASVVAVTDIDGKRAKEVAAGLGARALSTGRDLVDAADVDAVVVTSWGPTHEEFVLASIAAGKPVFCEKPLATTAAGSLRIVEAEMKHGQRLVQVGFMRRYDAGYRALREVVAGGKIGDPLMVHCAHRNPAVGDGYTTDMAITDTVNHEIDVLRWLLDDDYVAVEVIYPRIPASPCAARRGARWGSWSTGSSASSTPTTSSCKRSSTTWAAGARPARPPGTATRRR